MTVLSTVQAASLSLGLEVPSVLFSNTERTWVEMRTLVNECARQILDEYDWSALKATATVTGDGVSTAFDLPSDYSRMVQDANLWGPSYTFYPAQQIQDFNFWLEMLMWDPDTWNQRWSVFGGKLNIVPVLPLGETLVYGYITDNIVSGGGDVFNDDTQTFVLDERLLKLSIIWNWKKAKGQDYAAELQEYENDANRAKFRDVGARQTIYTGRPFLFPTGQTLP